MKVGRVSCSIYTLTSRLIDRRLPIVREVPETDDLRVTYQFTKRFMYNAIRRVFEAANVRPTKSQSHWNLFWGHHLKVQEYAALLSCQQVNHFPGSFELGRKDRLCANLLRMRKRHPTAYEGIIPDTYLTANDYDRQQFLLQFQANPRAMWILKPPNSSCGRGILILTAESNSNPPLSKKKAYVAQRYIASPYLINGLKFDLRIYVLVNSYDPLRIYLFDDGLVRFCTEKYSTNKSGMQNPFGHLTNYSVNKKNTAAFQQNQDGQDDAEAAFSSSKWSLQMLYAYLKDQSQGDKLVSFQLALEDLIIKTIIAVEARVLSAASHGGKSNGFELYGFDILLESKDMRPWLLEVNVFPSLSSSSPMDKRIKTILVSDLFQLVGVPFQDTRGASQKLEQEKQERFHGLTAKKDGNTAKTGSKAAKKSVTDLLQQKKLDVDADDLQIVKDMEEEDLRRGHFRRIFPTAQSFDRYSGLFETQRYRNVLCMRWLQEASGREHQRRRAHSCKP